MDDDIPQLWDYLQSKVAPFVRNLFAGVSAGTVQQQDHGLGIWEALTNRLPSLSRREVNPWYCSKNFFNGIYKLRLQASADDHWHNYCPCIGLVCANSIVISRPLSCSRHFESLENGNLKSLSSHMYIQCNSI